jgi:uroporphyrinogen decarboxylase
MTQREIIIANLERQDPPRPGMTFDNGRINDMIFGRLDVAAEKQPKRWTEQGKEYYYDEWGNLWARMADGCEKGEIHTPFLTDWDKLEQLQPPESTSAELYKTMTAEFAQADELYKVAMIGGWIFNDARYLRKMDAYFMDMHLYPDKLDRLHNLIAEVYEVRISRAAAAGADAIFFLEDMGTQTGLLFSPDLFRRFFKDIYRRLFGIAHDCGLKVLQHSCGYNWQIIDDLIEIGIDCFQFDQPALYDMPALSAKLKEHKVALWSPVDIQKVMPTGDRKFIEEQTELMLNIFEGGLIMKNYPDLKGIGVDEQWDMWAYDTICRKYGLNH